MNRSNFKRAFSDNPKSKIQYPTCLVRACSWIVVVSIAVMACLFPSLAAAQAKPLRELKVGYPLGGSSSYFWVAQRSGSFEKYGLKIEPIYIRGGLMGIQAALSGDLNMQLQGASSAVSAWAQGGKDLQFIGAVGNRLDYILAAHLFSKDWLKKEK